MGPTAHFAVHRTIDACDVLSAVERCDFLKARKGFLKAIVDVLEKPIVESSVIGQICASASVTVFATGGFIPIKFFREGEGTRCGHTAFVAAGCGARGGGEFGPVALGAVSGGNSGRF